MDISGKKFGSLTAIRRLEEKKNGSYLWICKCDCGNTTEVKTDALTSGNVISCGCVANALGYSNPRDAISRHCKGVVKHDSFKEGGQEIALIPEGDIYRLVIKSQLPTAEKFESWIFDEVLPTIRKHGAYMTDDTLEKASSILSINS